MKINQISLSEQNNKTSFTSHSIEKPVLGTLEKISDHGASFVLAASFVGASVIRPLAISLTPKTDTENKKYASAQSLSSALMKLLVAEVVALPVENAIKKIDENPQKYMNKKTVENFFNDKKSYKFLTQTIKQAANLLSAVPKSCLTVTLIPFVMDKVFLRSKKPEKKQDFNPLVFKNSKEFKAFDKISFTGKLENILPEGISKIINNESVQNFSRKNSKNANNIARNFTILSDITLMSMGIFQTKKSKKIKEERKKPLIYNNLFSTLASIFAGFGLDNIVQKTTRNAVENFKTLHKNNPKLDKYIEGINIARPTIIFALIYYGILPVITTYLADKMPNEDAKKISKK